MAEPVTAADLTKPTAPEPSVLTPTAAPAREVRRFDGIGFLLVKTHALDQKAFPGDHIVTLEVPSDVLGGESTRYTVVLPEVMAKAFGVFMEPD